MSAENSDGGVREDSGFDIGIADASVDDVPTLDSPSWNEVRGEFSPDVEPRTLTPLYEPAEHMTTRGFFVAGDVLVNEFTTNCGMSCPDGLHDGDVGLNSWRVVTDAHGRFESIHPLDTVILGNILEDEFDRIDEQSPALIYRDGLILRNTRARTARAFQSGPRGVHLIEFDEVTGVFGLVSNGVHASESIVEPLYLKYREVDPLPSPELRSFGEFVTQPFIQSIHGGHLGFGTAVFNPVFATAEMGALAVGREFDDSEREYWVNNGQRLLTYYGDVERPILLYTSARDSSRSRWFDISERLAEVVHLDAEGAFWANRPFMAHGKRKNLIHPVAPISGLWRDMPASIVVDTVTGTVDLQTYESSRPAAAAAFFDAVIRSSLIEPEVIDLSPMGFHEHILQNIDADELLVSPLLELSDSATDTTVAGLLSDDLNQAVEQNQSGLTVGEWLAQKLTAALHERLMALPPDAVQEAEFNLARAVVDLLLQGDNFSQPALTRLVRQGLAAEVEGLNERDERQRLARRVIRPYSDFSDEMLRPLGEFIEDFVDDPISELVGETVGLINDIYGIASVLPPALRLEPECGFLPEDAVSFARGMFGVEGAGLDESNMVFIEAMKLGEYEGQTNYSFARRLSDLLESARGLDRASARPLVDALAQISGFEAHQGADVHLVRNYGQRLDFRAVLLAVSDGWFRALIKRHAPMLFELRFEALQDAEPGADTVSELLAFDDQIQAILAMHLGQSLGSFFEEDGTPRALLDAWLWTHPLIHQGRNQDVAIRDIMVRRVALDHRYARLVGQFLESELEPYISGWLVNGGIESVVTDAEKAERDDCLATWQTTLYTLYYSLAPGSPAAETVQAIRLGLREVATHVRRTLYVSAVGGVVSPLVQRHRRVTDSFVFDLMPMEPEQFELSELFLGDVVWIEAFLLLDQLVLAGRVDTEDGARLQAATIKPGGAVTQYDIGPMGEAFLGVTVNEREIMFAQIVDRTTQLKALSIETGSMRDVLSYDRGLLTDWSRWQTSKVNILRMRNEPFEGPVTTHRLPDQWYQNGQERSLDGMLYFVSP